MDRENLKKLEDNFRTFVQPLLNEKDMQDYHFLWEFEKFLNAKTLQVLTAEHEGMKKWKALLLSR